MLFGVDAEQHIPRLGEAKFILSKVEGLGMTVEFYSVKLLRLAPMRLRGSRVAIKHVVCQINNNLKTRSW
jgi:hypothetical protein